MAYPRFCPFRIIVASGLAWAVAIILPMEDFWPENKQHVVKLAVVVMQLISIALVTYLNVSVYTGRSAATKNKLLQINFP